MMRTALPTAVRDQAPAPGGGRALQRSCAKCEEEGDRTLQRRASDAGDVTHLRARAMVDDTVRASGRPLDAGVRRRLEPLFGHSFEKVRIHDDSQADESARGVAAHAYTLGSHVVFRRGAYSPGTHAGDRLLAHELAHVVQQARGPAGTSSVQAWSGVSHPGDAAEVEADRAADAVIAGQRPALAGAATPPSVIQRAWDPCLCVFKFNTGKLKIDASCRGSLSIWIVPEDGATPAFTPATAGVEYEADGYKIGNQLYKIDGSTCVSMTCDGGRPNVSTCVNNLAGLMGKRDPYPVPAGTFGNEPPAGVPASPVV